LISRHLIDDDLIRTILYNTDAMNGYATGGLIWFMELGPTGLSPSIYIADIPMLAEHV